MRRTTFIHAIVLVLALIGSWLAPVNAGEDAASHIVRSDQREFDGIDFKGQTEFEISDPDAAPATRTGCNASWLSLRKSNQGYSNSLHSDQQSPLGVGVL